jgi:hypothetical protein
MSLQQNQRTEGTSPDRLKAMQRKPVRISITISHALHNALLRVSDEQGRSLSNLAAYLLETANAASLSNQRTNGRPV